MPGVGDSPRAAVLCHQLCDLEQQSPGTALSRPVPGQPARSQEQGRDLQPVSFAVEVTPKCSLPRGLRALMMSAM